MKSWAAAGLCTLTFVVGFGMAALLFSAKSSMDRKNDMLWFTSQLDEVRVVTDKASLLAHQCTGTDNPAIRKIADSWREN